MFFFDPLYFIFIGPAFLFMLYAQWRVRSAYGKWSKEPNRSNVTGAKATQLLLSQNAINDVTINTIAGELSDNYDPRNKSLNLSQGVSQGESVAALAIAAHEIGHAEQHARSNPLLTLRGILVPAVNFGSRLGPILFFIGILLMAMVSAFAGLGELLAWFGLGLFSLTFIFALITLPVEIDASQRAMRMLTQSNLLVDNRELRGARAVLTAAALTYVASMLIALFQLLYYVTILIGRRD